ncbi:MAG: DUF2116 family Zn-ribbon domain-containing protein [Candidatus Njordarchaeales archaeon]
MKKKQIADLIQVPPHAHCLWCRKPIPVNKLFCSVKCEQAYNRWRRKKNLLSFAYLGVGFILMIIAIYIIGF